MSLNKISTIVCGYLVYIIALNHNLVYNLMYNGDFDYVSYSSFHNMLVCFMLWILCLIPVICVKYAIYQLIGLVLGMTPLTGLEDFWLYDLPINPMNIPSILVFNKTDKDPNEMLESML